MDTLSFWSNISSLCGLLIGIGGFWFTYINIKKSRTAAEKAQVAAEKAIEQVSNQVLHNEATQAVRLAQDMVAACNHRDWDRAWDRAVQVKMLVGALIEHNRILQQEKDTMKHHLDDLRSAVSKIEKCQRDDSDRNTNRPNIESLHRLVDTLVAIAARKRNLEVKIADA